MKENKNVNDLIELLWSINEYHIRYLKIRGLTPGSFFLLYFLRKYPDGLEPSELAGHVLIKRQLTTALLNQFEKLNYLCREISKVDHRKRIVTLTKSGRNFFDQVHNDICAIDRCGLANLSEEEQNQFLLLLQRYREGILASQMADQA